MPEISAKNKQLFFSPIRKLMPYAVAAKKRGVKVYHLNIGQPDIESPAIFLQKVKEFDQKTVAYEKSDGNEAFKQSLAQYYQRLGLDIKEEDLVVTSGGSEALMWLFAILFNPGDECLCFEPTYANYLTFSCLNGVKIVPVLTKLADNFQLTDAKTLLAKYTPKTKAVIITNPSNPTGAVYPPKMLQEIVDFCVEKDLFIIADETYREFIYGAVKTVSLLSFKEAAQLVVEADSLSKRYSLCGARLGMIVTKNKSVLEMATKIAQARLAAATIEQYAASFLDQVPLSYFTTVKQEYQLRRDTLMAELAKIPGVKFSRPEGAFYLIAELPIDNAEEFCKFLLEEFSEKQETVMLAPAADFYVTPGQGKNQVRIAYVLNCAEIKRAVELVGLGLKAYGKIS